MDTNDTLTSEPSTTENSGITGRFVGGLDSFKSSPGPTAPTSPGTAGKTKAPIGRPRKDGTPSGTSSTKSTPPPLPKKEEVERQIDRRDFEILLVELLSSVTEDLAAYRFKILTRVHTENIAKEQADKALLTPMEKKYFSKMVVRLYEKYVSENFEYSDEMMTAALVARYFLRNREPARLTAEILGTSNAKSNDPSGLGLRRPTVVNFGDNGNGKDNISRPGSASSSG